ncbi:MAG: RnfABCDGE type electron transport complex subunit D [Evtepia sp.]
MNEHKLSVASSPHASSPVGTRNLMLDVIIALIPALVIAIWVFGLRALTMTLVSVIACEFFEWGYRKLMKKSNSLMDLSAAITGILIAFVCPVTLPYWTLIIGDFFGIVIVKQLFGGLGMNFVNPALAARAFLFSYATPMTTWSVPFTPVGLLSAGEITTGATPLALMKTGGDAIQNLPSMAEMFIGKIGGCGEVSALMLLIGGIYLIIRGVIRPRIPIAFIATVAIWAFIFPKAGMGNFDWMMYSILGGGVFLGAFFMATDYVTSPNTPRGELIYGIGCGLLTMFIRYFGAYPEGVSYAILIMNVCVWLIDTHSKPARFGVSAEDRKAAKLKAKEDKKQAKEVAAS